MKLIIATNNAHKAREIREILSADFSELHTLAEAGLTIEVLEDGATFAENAKKKAEAVLAAAAGYDAALADWGEPYGQPEALRQGYCTVNSLAELDGSLCLFASEVGQDGTERTGLAVCDTGDEALEWLIPPTSDVTLGNLQEQNGERSGNPFFQLADFQRRHLLLWK